MPTNTPGPRFPLLRCIGLSLETVGILFAGYCLWNQRDQMHILCVVWPTLLFDCCIWAVSLIYTLCRWRRRPLFIRALHICIFCLFGFLTFRDLAHRNDRVLLRLSISDRSSTVLTFREDGRWDGEMLSWGNPLWSGGRYRISGDTLHIVRNHMTDSLILLVDPGNATFYLLRDSAGIFLREPDESCSCRLLYDNREK